MDRNWPGARASGVARTRLIDDLVAQALTEGFEQLVILGAGYDSRAYRLPGIERATVFEVDDPATQGEKRRLLNVAGKTAPANLHWGAIDFNNQSLEDVLAESGFDPTRPAFFIWEGVTNYLSEDAVDRTLRFVASTRPGNRIVFTYVTRQIIQELNGSATDTTLSRTLKRAGELWTFGLDPEEVGGYLQKRGLRLIEDMGSVEYRAQYMGRSPRILSGYEFYRAAVAEVRENLG